MRKRVYLTPDMELRIKDVCRSQHLKMIDVANKVGITKSYLSRVNSGKVKPSFELLQKIADAMDVPVHRLIVAPEGYDHFEVEGDWHGIRKI
tara:strand:- start:578 stop:853 length:276 start_codon:yes stop_codon:yes gene_type:complete